MCSSDLTLEKLCYAPFDERLSVVGMLLGRLNELFRGYVEADRYVTLLHTYLKGFIEDGDLKGIVQRAAQEYEGLRREERLDKAGGYIYRRVNDTLEAYRFRAAKDHLDKQGTEEMVRAAFQEEVKKREAAAGEAGQALSCAFDFLEDAFEIGRASCRDRVWQLVEFGGGGGGG